MKLKLLSVLALCLASIASAQLTITPQGASAFAAAVNASAIDQTTLDTVGASSPASIVLNGLTFSSIPNLDSYTVSPGFFVDVSFVGRDEVDTDNLFAQVLPSAPAALYAPFTSASTSQGFHLTGDATFSFLAQDSSFGSHAMFSQSDISGFKFYEAIDVSANRIYDLLLVDDRRSEYVDFNDQRLIVESNLNPVGLAPVPEASTYGLLGGILLMGLVIRRRLNRS